MGHQIEELQFSAESGGDHLKYIEGEMRRLCEMIGFRLEPISYRNEAGIAPASFRHSSHGSSAHENDTGRKRACDVRRLLKRRRQRERFFPSDLFADPAWDILLDLYAAYYEDRQISVSSACIAANVPATTALRWLKTLTDNGLIDRVPDLRDGRRILVAISEKSRKQLDAYFDEIEDD